MILGHDPKLDLLAGIPLFHGTSRNDLRLIAAATTELRVAAGEVLCREGHRGSEFFVVVDGEASVSIGDREVARVGAGGFFGEMALIDGGPRTATVAAATPMDVLVLNRGEFDAVLDQVPAVARQVLHALGDRIRANATALDGRSPLGA
jgi:CRP-like cAMP-binding protein